MRMPASCRSLTAVILACGVLFHSPCLILAAVPGAKPGQLQIIDVALSAGGTLQGSVLDRQGGPRAGMTVTIHRAGEPAAETSTDHAGRFLVTGLRGGLYTVQAEQQQTPVRLWAAGTAPPVAGSQVVLHSSGRTVRAQLGSGQGWWNLATAALIGGGGYGLWKIIDNEEGS